MLNLSMTQMTRFRMLRASLALLVLAGSVWQTPVIRAQEPAPLPSLGQEAGPAVAAADQPIIARVDIVGNSLIPTERIMSKIKTHASRPYLKDQVRDDVRRLYATYWFYDVAAEEKATPEGLVIIYRVIEKPTITEVRYIGNTVLNDAKLNELTGLRAGKSMDPALNKEMARRIESKYREKGYPFASVELSEGGTRGDSRVVLKITEGPKTKIHKVDFEGTSFVSEARLKTMVASKARILFLGGGYDADRLEEDIAKLIEYYRGHGFLDVRVGRRLDWTEDKSGVRVTFEVSEGMQYKVRDVRFAGNEIYKEETLEPKLKLVNGATFEKTVLDKDVREIQNEYGRNGYINAVVQPDIRYLDEPGVVDVVYKVREDLPRKVGEIKVVGNEVTKQRVIRSRMTLEPGQIADTTKLAESQQRLLETRLFETDASKNVMPTVQFDPSNDPADEFQDVLVNVQETQTGSLMFGLGVNSDAGLGGSIVLHERNFDLFRLPTSFNDLYRGRAFRGAGQEFRLEAVPGTEVQRYSATFSEPQLFGLDYRLSTSGYFFRRIYNNYDEERAGGRFTLGKRFTRTIGASLTYRLENIGISDPIVPTPPDLTAVLGDNFLTSIRAGIDHDTRDSHMSPGSGHYVELAYEQAFGDFDFPRVTLEGRQYFTVRSRADGSGKHTITARGQLGYSGDDTPIFERFYAGGFQSLRGFQYRGVGPTVFGTEVGGNFMLLGGLEYQFPLTADDNLGWVFFCDTGTVESDVEILDYRVAVGFGLRVQVPAFGPVPFAFDFGFPVVKTDQDDDQLFSFFLGYFR